MNSPYCREINVLLYNGSEERGMGGSRETAEVPAGQPRMLVPTPQDPGWEGWPKPSNLRPSARAVSHQSMFSSKLPKKLSSKESVQNPACPLLREEGCSRQRPPVLCGVLDPVTTFPITELLPLEMILGGLWGRSVLTGKNFSTNFWGSNIRNQGGKLLSTQRPSQRYI